MRAERARQVTEWEPQEERRRSSRILWRIPFVATWKMRTSVVIREQGETEVVSSHGALIKLATAVRTGQRLRILRPGRSVAEPARVICKLGQDSDGKNRLGVELENPSSTFWVELAR